MRYADLFPATYEASRESFVAGVERGGGRLESHRHPGAGPVGEGLFMDVARFGAAVGEARRVLFVGAGTHGVEGRAGAGILRALLAEGSLDPLPRGVAVVLVHAINPFGFARSRRVDAENVDVNRNFIDHDGPHPRNVHYEALRRAVNASPELEDARAAQRDSSGIVGLAMYGAIAGLRPMLRAAMGGQYVDPDGLSYGGVAPCWSNRTVREVWARHAGPGVELAVFLDVHSGLGPRGVGTILQGADAGDPRIGLARRLFGRVHLSPRPAPGRTIVFGELATGFEDACEAARSLGVILEFGTYDPIRVFSALRAESWVHRHGDPASLAGAAIEKALRDAFFIDDERFRAAVVERGIEVVEDAIAGMKSA